MQNLACLSNENLTRFVQGALREQERIQAGEHILVCTECAQRLDALVSSDPLLASLPTQASLPLDDPLVPSLVSALLKSPPSGWDTTIADDKPPKPGAMPTIPGYEILEILGQGGQSVVYRAVQTKLGRLVALKTVSGGSSAADRMRFQREAEAVAQLKHPNIVQIHDIGEHEGHLFLALEYVAGGTLAHRLAGTPQPPTQAAELIHTLARTVHAVHVHGIVHRDLKPGNILLTTEGVPKVVDFGLAKRSETDSHLTHSGVLIGTPAYMAPEQASAQGKDVGPAADIYALGAILYEMLTGRPPFTGRDAWEVIPQVIRADPVAPRSLQPNVPRDLQTICLKCLQKETGRRYADAQSLADDLQRYLQGLPVLARPIGPVQRLSRWSRRNPMIAGLIALVVVVACAGFAGILWEWRQAEDRADETAIALRTAQRHLYFHQVGLADRNWWGDDLAAARRLLAQAPPELRHLEWRLLDWRCNSASMTVATKSTCVAYDSIRGILATTANGEVILWNERGDKLRTLSWPRDSVRDIYSLAFSPDGKLLAAAGDRATDLVPIWEVSSGRIVHELPGHPGGARRVVFRADGRQLACGTGSIPIGKVMLWNLATGKCDHVLEDDGRAFEQLAYSPDSKWIAGANWSFRVNIWDAHSGKKLNAMEGFVSDLAFSPDSRYLAGASVDKDSAKLWEVRTGKTIGQPFHTRSAIRTLSFDPNQRLAAGCADGTIHVWHWCTGELLRVWRGHEDNVHQIAFSADGHQLASVGDSLRLWNSDLDQEAQLITHYTDLFALRPDGRQIATATHDNHTITLWNTDSIQVERTIRGTGHKVVGLAFAKALLAAAYEDGTIQLFDAATGKQTHKFHHARVSTLAFSRDALRLATTGISSGAGHSSIRIWDPCAEQPVAEWQTSLSHIRHMTFSRDDCRLLVAGSTSQGHEVFQMDAKRGAVLNRYTGGHRLCIASRPDKNEFAMGGIQSTVDVIGSDDEARPLANAAARALAFSRDGARLATADKSVRLWDMASGNETLALTVPARYFPSSFFTDEEKRANGIFFTDVQLADPLIAARTCEGSVWLWKPSTASPSNVRMTMASFQSVPIGIPTLDVLAPFGVRWENSRGRPIAITPASKFGLNDPVPGKGSPTITVMPLGSDRTNWVDLDHTKPSVEDTRIFHFDRPLRGVGLTRIGVINGASLPRWRLESLDADGNILATTGEMEFPKDAIPRTYWSRADGIRMARVICDNNRGGGQPYSTFTALPLVELLLEE
jgi:WD40 repeat protein